MKFSVVSIFPEIIRHYAAFGLLGKAVESGRLQVDAYNLRDFTIDKHRKVDDRPFGGGPGMVMMPDPLFRCVEHIRETEPGRVILFSAYGEVLSQPLLKELAAESHLILVCGRYEGVDQRFIDALVDREISLGDYVLMGGEAAAEVLIEGVARMLPGVIGNPESVTSDSFFHDDQTAFPQYTQPRLYRGMEVPEILLGGHHAEIEKWRKNHQKRRNTHA